jgi:hypothetical protein
MANEYYSGQGSVYVAERDTDTGAHLGFTELGNIPDLSISVAVTKFEHKESQSGSRAVDLTIVQEKKGSFSMTLESMSLDNLALAFWGSKTLIVAGTSVVQADWTAYLGKSTPLNHVGVTNADFGAYEYGLTMGTTAVPGDSKNGWIDELHGTVHTFSDAEQTARGATLNTTDVVAGKGQVISVTYDHSSQGVVDAFQETSVERYLRFEGLNTVDETGGKEVVVELFKAQLDPLADYGLINEELGTLTITGSLLYDDKQTGDSNFFRQINLD